MCFVCFVFILFYLALVDRCVEDGLQRWMGVSVEAVPSLP